MTTTENREQTKHIFSRKLEDLRESIGMNQKKFAEMIGISSQTISQYERGNKLPCLDIFRLICDCTSMPYEYFLREVNDYQDSSADFEVKKIAKHYGKAKQSIKAIEEMAEATKELTKAILGDGNRDRIIKEIADAQLMLEQLVYLFGISQNELDSVRKYKVQRTLERIGNEEVSKT